MSFGPFLRFLRERLNEPQFRPTYIIEPFPIPERGPVSPPPEPEELTARVIAWREAALHRDGLLASLRATNVADDTFTEDLGQAHEELMDATSDLAEIADLLRGKV